MPTKRLIQNEQTRLIRERLAVGLEVIDLCSHIPSLTANQLTEVETVFARLLRWQEQVESELRQRTAITDDRLARLWAVEDRRWHQPGDARTARPRACRLCTTPSLPLEVPCPQPRTAVAA